MRPTPNFAFKWDLQNLTRTQVSKILIIVTIERMGYTFPEADFQCLQLFTHSNIIIIIIIIHELTTDKILGYISIRFTPRVVGALGKLNFGAI